MGIIDDYYGGYESLAFFTDEDGVVDFEAAYGEHWQHLGATALLLLHNQLSRPTSCCEVCLLLGIRAVTDRVKANLRKQLTRCRQHITRWLLQVLHWITKLVVTACGKCCVMSHAPAVPAGTCQWPEMT
jgi:hypothetical protein